MINTEQNTQASKSITSNEQLSVLRITALWAFSESAFGGILHALTVPLRGLFIASAAVLFISLIALFSKSNKDVLKATLIVVLIKAVVSPHSPLTAYLAVSLQGVLGFLFFSTKKFYKLSTLLLGLLVLFLSGLQKIIILTILFGNTLWESLNLFIEQVSSEFLGITNPDINYGYFLIGIYLSLHVAAGLFIGIYAGKLPNKIDYYKKVVPTLIENNIIEDIPKKGSRKKKNWFLRPTGIFIILLSAGVIVLSYSSDELENNAAVSVIFMLVRALMITFIWYYLLAPFFKKLFQKFAAKRKSVYSKEIEEIMSMFPQFKKIVNFCWKNSKNKKGLKRIRYFLSTSFYYLLLSK